MNRPAKEKSGLPMTTAHGKETGMAIPSQNFMAKLGELTGI
jgi:hypothetical protein